MVLKCIPERLVKEELQYELKIRGLPSDGLVKDLRVAFRKVLKKESDDETNVAPIYPFSIEEDLSALGKGKDTVEKLLVAFETSPAIETSLTIETKLTHYINRMNNLRPLTHDDELLKKEFNVDFSMLMLKYELLVSKSENFKLNTASELDPVNAPLASSQPVVVEPRTICVKSTPVVKWNLKFSGESRSLSLSAFLERVDELVIARNVDLIQLFDEAIDLFSGKALIWFRANRSKATTWPELVALLNKEFRPIDYDDRLMDEIKRRTQGADENISIYVAIMQTMFSRLLEPLDENKKLRIVLRNLTPFYQSQLGLTVIANFEELLNYGRTIEERRSAIENYAPPSRKKNDLETDLAYLSLSPNSNHNRDTSINTVSTTRLNYGREQNFSRGRGRGNLSRGRGNRTSSQVSATNTCWNCNNPNHFSANCPEPQRQMYCYRCGSPGVTTRTCAKCNQNGSLSENSEGTH